MIYIKPRTFTETTKIIMFVKEATTNSPQHVLSEAISHYVNKKNVKALFGNNPSIAVAYITWHSLRKLKHGCCRTYRIFVEGTTKHHTRTQEMSSFDPTRTQGPITRNNTVLNSNILNSELICC